ncbi:MAG: hypothetical protein IJP16_04675 [Clostridia bacterium]|nr:hypothetical protein [Clostridia bacterium]
MKRNYLIGLGGSGGKIITHLYSRLMRERGISFESDVECIAIDTEQSALEKLSELGVKKVLISGEGCVGDYFNALPEDVGEWCPNTEDDTVFFNSDLFNGASQCRLKSRLCLARFLKNENNELRRAIESSLEVSSSTDGSSNRPPIVLIASSIAGGTGSGIFIQTALYIKKLFKEKYNIPKVIIHGLFACPDLYENVVKPEQKRSIFANAYAVIRELNAFNLICGNDKTDAYGAKIDPDIEISTDCEGNLFTKDQEGRYGDKPYDFMYFIDKVSCMSTVHDDIGEYYKEMADIAYSHLYTDISDRVWENESNEMNNHTMAPGSIYGSAGASSIVYPYDDIIKYFASRSIKESVDTVWYELEKLWEAYYAEKDAEARATGMPKYIPEDNERAEHYINDFDNLVKTAHNSSSNRYAFLGKEVMADDDKTVVDALLGTIKAKATSFITSKKIDSIKSDCGLTELDGAKVSINDSIDEYSVFERDTDDKFSVIQNLDNALENYCTKALKAVIDYSMTFANKIYCDDLELCSLNDRSEFGIINGALTKDGEWAHPVAVRYILYSLKKKFDSEMKSIWKSVNDTPADDDEDILNHLVGITVASQKKKLNNNSKSEKTNEDILEALLKKMIGGKSAAKLKVEEYFTELNSTINSIDTVLADALLYFSYLRIQDKIDALIAEYELFFDNLKTFCNKADATAVSYSTLHDNKTDALYVCASSEIKDKMYSEVGRNINTQTGEIISNVSCAIFTALRQMAANTVAKKKNMSTTKINGTIEGIFQSVFSIVADGIKDIPSVRNMDKNVFDAMLYEYELTDENATANISNYSNSEIKTAKEIIDRFFVKKFSTLVYLAAPLLVFGAKDPYSGMFDKNENGVIKEKPSYSTYYRYLSFNRDVGNSIVKLLGGNGDANQFYSSLATSLPKDSNDQTVSFDTVYSEKVNKYTLLCYSTVHCLQPYQIKAFDELNGGRYYEYYAERIAEMEDSQRYSLTPHLDKRWHKRGCMPFINVNKELKSRLDIGKAFIYALCFGLIRYYKNGSDVKYVFAAPPQYPAEIIIYKGQTVSYNNINRVMCWFADQEPLVEKYAAKFDKAINAEIAEMIEAGGDTVGGYKRAITRKSKFFHWMKVNMLRPIDIMGSKNTRAKAIQEEEPISLLELAYQLHVREEMLGESDRNYAELIIDVLCEVIDLYAAAPFNADDIKEQREHSVGYTNYLDVEQHIASQFLSEYAKSVLKKSAIKTKVNTEEPAEEAQEVTKKRRGWDAPIEELVEEDESLNTKKLTIDGISETDLENKRIRWAIDLFNMFLNDKD